MFRLNIVANGTYPLSGTQGPGASITLSTAESGGYDGVTKLYGRIRGGSHALVPIPALNRKTNLLFAADTDIPGGSLIEVDLSALDVFLVVTLWTQGASEIQGDEAINVSHRPPA